MPLAPMQASGALTPAGSGPSERVCFRGFDVLKSPEFHSTDHEKAWIIRVTINACRDLLRSFFHSRTLPLDSLREKPGEPAPDHSDVLEAVLALPSKYKDVIYLYYYEEYSAEEIGQILRKNKNTVYTLLNRGRQLLRSSLEEVGENG